MRKITLSFLFSLLSAILLSQEQSFNRFLSDSTMNHASVSFCVIEADSGKILFDYNPDKSLIPASVLKLITSASALELLGSDYCFRTKIGYTGYFNRQTGRLRGNIIIKGGGDPVLGSKNFEEYYAGFTDKWVEELRKLGIKRIRGRVISDDSYYDFMPVPARWLWEDAGNYYGAGAYGISVYDNTYEIHFNTTYDTTNLTITEIRPEACRFEFANWLVATGTSDNGYVFAAPYSTNGWLAGSVPRNLPDFVLKASITDPPLLLAKVVDQKLKVSGITVSGPPTTTRLLKSFIEEPVIYVNEIVSPPLKDIVKVLNHESVNMYAEHLVKELGKVFMKKGSTESGVQVIKGFLKNAGIDCSGVFIEDGSGLSPLDAVSSKGISELLLYMKKYGRSYNDFVNSLPDAGKEGTLKNYFIDPVFENNLKVKSGTLTRVKSYAGYFKTSSGKELIFSIIVNNFTGPAGEIVPHIEEILKEIIQTR